MASACVQSMARTAAASRGKARRMAKNATTAQPITTSASEIALGINECDLVRLKGAKPDDVLIGESGKGQRETQVLYAEPGGRELYLFTDNRLTKIVKPGQG